MEEQNFLTVDYGSIGFLINKAQFYSSCYMEKEVRASSPIPYLDRVFTYGDERILVFDMHEALRRLFSIDSNGKAELLLIVEFSKLANPVRDIFTRMKSGKNSISRQHLGLRIKSDARMISMKVGKLRLLPVPVRGYLKRFGILACTFPSDRTINYLIEVDNICKTFIEEALQQHKGR